MTRPRRARTIGRQRPPAPVNRAPLGPDAVRAAYGAHKGSEHDGELGYDCRTCARYLAAVAVALERATMSACRGSATDPAPPAGTDANTEPNDSDTSPRSNGQAPDCAPNACASSDPGSSPPPTTCTCATTRPAPS